MSKIGIGKEYLSVKNNENLDKARLSEDSLCFYDDSSSSPRSQLTKTDLSVDEVVTKKATVDHIQINSYIDDEGTIYDGFYWIGE